VKRQNFFSKKLDKKLHKMDMQHLKIR